MNNFHTKVSNDEFFPNYGNSLCNVHFKLVQFHFNNDNRLQHKCSIALNIVHLAVTNNLIKNTSGVKKKQPRTKTGLAKDLKSNGQAIPPGFDSFESFGHDELTVKHCYLRCTRPPDVDGINFLIKMTKNLHCVK